MPCQKISTILAHAKENHYAVGAFNADNLEMVQAFISAAEKTRSALILQVSRGAIGYAGLESVTNLALFEAQRASVPVAVHLDHVADWATTVRAFRAGVGSLCMDAADKPYAENLALTSRVSELAHHVGLDMEAGLGYVPDSRDGPTDDEMRRWKTDPEQARHFIAEGGVDLLAVSIGSMRSMRERSIALDIDLLRKLRDTLDIPLVLHGASGVYWESIQEAIRNGICKVNIASTFDNRFTAVMREELAANPQEGDFRKILSIARDAVESICISILEKLGSVNQYS